MLLQLLRGASLLNINKFALVDKPYYKFITTFVKVDLALYNGFCSIIYCLFSVLRVLFTLISLMLISSVYDIFYHWV